MRKEKREHEDGNDGEDGNGDEEGDMTPPIYGMERKDKVDSEPMTRVLYMECALSSFDAASAAWHKTTRYRVIIKANGMPQSSSNARC
jgi:hypothetical protein